jgi:putative endopeptidase
VKRYLLSTLTLSMMAAFAGAADNVHSAAAGTTSGIDTQYIDQGVRVQDDFFTHLNGKWLQDDRDPVGPHELGHLHETARRHPGQIRGIIEAEAEEAGQEGRQRRAEDRRPVHQLHGRAKLDALGTKPLAGELQRIRALKDKKGVPALVAHLSQIGVATPTASAWPRMRKESTKYATYIRQGGLGLPDRDYYLKMDDKRKLAGPRPSTSSTSPTS